MIKFGTAQILSAELGGNREQRRTAARTVGITGTTAVILKQAHRAEFEYTPKPGFLYVRSRAISSRCNDNFDEFPADEIKQAYGSFMGKPVFVNHNNSNHHEARGVIIDAALHEDTNADGSPDVWTEVLMEVDAVKFPMLAKAILAGEVDRTSMGCFLPGTPITMYDGTHRAIEDIVVGDEVLTHQGNVAKVTDLMRTPHDGLVYDIRVYGQAHPLVATCEHPMWVKKDKLSIGQSRRKGLSRTTTCECGIVYPSSQSLAAHLREVRRRGFIGEHRAIEAEEIPAWVEAWDVTPGDWVLTPISKRDDSTSSSGMATLLGYYLAEGSLGYDKNRKEGPCWVQWDFNEKEVEYIQEIVLALRSEGFKEAGPYFKSGSASIRCNSPELAEELLDLGGVHCDGKVLAPEVLGWCTDHQRMLLEKYFNGDGCYRDNRVEAGTSSKVLAEQLHSIAVRVGIPMTPPIKQHSPSAADKRPKYVMQAVLEPNTKSVGYHQVCPDADGQWRRVMSVSIKHYEGMVYNFDVDGDDSYVASDVAVHNCDVAFSVCSACGNKASSPSEYCVHIPKLKGHQYVRYNAKLGRGESEIIREICHGLSFFENSLLVEDPADPTAYFLGVDARGLSSTAAKYTFDIDFAHTKDSLKAGEVVGGTHRVTVEADSPNEGRLIADQMVGSTGREPTGARRIASVDEWGFISSIDDRLNTPDEARYQQQMGQPRKVGPDFMQHSEEAVPVAPENRQSEGPAWDYDEPGRSKPIAVPKDQGIAWKSEWGNLPRRPASPTNHRLNSLVDTGSLTVDSWGFIHEAARTPKNDLADKTPFEVDSALAAHHETAARAKQGMSSAVSQMHYLVGDKQKPHPYNRKQKVWGKSDKEVLATEPSSVQPSYNQRSFTEQQGQHATHAAALDHASSEISRHNTEFDRRGGWSRFFLVPDGHIHSSTACHSCRPTTPFSWLPHLSGKSEKQAVEAHGPHLCTHCFPSAPVEWKRDPTETRAEEKKKSGEFCEGGTARHLDRDEIKRRKSEHPKGLLTLNKGEAFFNGRDSMGKCPTCGTVQKVKNSGELYSHKPPKPAPAPKPEPPKPSENVLPPPGKALKTHLRSKHNYTPDDHDWSNRLRGQAKQPPMSLEEAHDYMHTDSWDKPKHVHSTETSAALHIAESGIQVTETSPEDFHRRFTEATTGSPYQYHVTPHSPEEIRSEGMNPLLANGGQAGVLIHHHGDGRVEATGLFRHPDAPKGVGMDLFRHVVQNHGVNYAEAFEPKLTDMYKGEGFETSEHIPFDPELADKNWNYKRFGKPPVAIMHKSASLAVDEWGGVRVVAGPVHDAWEYAKSLGRDYMGDEQVGFEAPQADMDNAYEVHGSHHPALGRILKGHRQGAKHDEAWEARWGHSDEPAPVPDFAVHGAHQYRAEHGLPEDHTDYGSIMADKDRHAAIAKAYSKMPARDPRARPAYEALAHEVGQQYDHMTKNLGVHVTYHDHDPYKDHHEMARDVAENHHLGVLRTATTLGPGETPEHHPHFSDEQNDRFRAVHDFFGHAATGRGFDRHGEEAAWRHHASMFSPLARRAMTTETRGQNASLIANGRFPHQKMALLPERFSDDDALDSIRHASLTNEGSLRMTADSSIMSPDEIAAAAQPDAPPESGGGGKKPGGGGGLPGMPEMGGGGGEAAGGASALEELAPLALAASKSKPWSAKVHKAGRGRDMDPKNLPGKPGANGVIGIAPRNNGTGPIKPRRYEAAQATPCQTNGAIYHTSVNGDHVEISVDLPRSLDLTEAAATTLERNMHNAMELVLAPHFVGQRKVAYGETVAPPEVDTLREDICPVCGEHDSYNGDKCMVCGFVKPPSMFMDPDVEVAQNLDLRSDQQDENAAVPEGTGDLVCPNCGSEFASAEEDNVEGDPHMAPAAESDPSGVDANGVPVASPDPAMAGEEEVNDEEDEQPDFLKKPKGDDEEAEDGDDAQEQPEDPEQPDEDAEEEDQAPEQAGGKEEEALAEEEVADEAMAAGENEAQTGYSEGDTCPACGQGILEPAESVESPEDETNGDNEEEEAGENEEDDEQDDQSSVKKASSVLDPDFVNRILSSYR